VSARSMFKRKITAPPKVDPRAVQAINEEYTSIAQQLGANLVQQESLKRQAQQLLNKVDELGAELKARTALDEAKEKETPSEPTQTNNDQKVG
jgi:alcohol dehydrogenase class IV